MITDVFDQRVQGQVRSENERAALSEDLHGSERFLGEAFAYVRAHDPDDEHYIQGPFLDHAISFLESQERSKANPEETLRMIRFAKRLASSLVGETGGRNLRPMHDV